MRAWSFSLLGPEKYSTQITWTQICLDFMCCVMKCARMCFVTSGLPQGAFATFMQRSFSTVSLIVAVTLTSFCYIGAEQWITADLVQSEVKNNAVERGVAKFFFFYSYYKLATLMVFFFQYIISLTVYFCQILHSLIYSCTFIVDYFIFFKTHLAASYFLWLIVIWTDLSVSQMTIAFYI